MKTIREVLKREGQSVFLQWVRAIIALGMVAVTCWKEASGEGVTESFGMLLAIIIAMYFKEGQLVVSTRQEPEKGVGEE